MLAMTCLAAGCTESGPMCAGDDLCRIEEGRYLQIPAASRHPTMAVMRVHGFGGTPTKIVMRDEDTRSSYADVLVVAPIGRGRTWNLPGFEGGPDRDEMAFAEAVMDAAEADWPSIEHWLVSGNSLGGTFAWEVGCVLGDRVLAVASNGGMYEAPHPGCATAAPLTHTHGTRDPAEPYGNAVREIDALVAARACTSTTVSFVDGEASCTRWESCEGGPVQFCTHSGGHSRPQGTLAREIEFAEIQLLDEGV